MKKIAMMILILTIAISGIFADSRSDAITNVGDLSPMTLQAIFDRAVRTESETDDILLEVGTQCESYLYVIRMSGVINGAFDIIREHWDYEMSSPEMEGLKFEEIPTDWVEVQLQMLRGRPKS